MGGNGLSRPGGNLGFKVQSSGLRGTIGIRAFRCNPMEAKDSNTLQPISADGSTA